MNNSAIKTKKQSIIDDIKSKIRNGTYTDKLPSIYDLAEEYNVNFKTVNNAYQSLAESGIITSKKGGGSFIKKTKNSPIENKMIPFFFPTRGHVYDPMYNTISSKLVDNNFLPILIINDDAEKKREQLNKLMDSSIDKIIICHDKFFPYDILKENEHRFKNITFLVEKYSEIDFNANHILSDYWYGAYIATKYLIDKGHERILHINYKSGAPAEFYRYTSHYKICSGYKDALAESGLSAREQYIFETDEQEHDEQVLYDLLISENRPSAIFAAADSRLVSAMKVIRQIGLKVPDDLALVGYYNTPHCTEADIPFTSVSIKEEEIVSEAVRKILSSSNEKERIYIKPELIIRASS